MMDLMDFEGENLYFEENLPPEVDALIQRAGGLYGEGEAEKPLLEALKLAPASLTVLVAVYRFYYYQHRLAEAMETAGRALEITAARLRLPLDWKDLTPAHISQGGRAAIALLRFHLLSLKAIAYLLLRLGRQEEGRAILTKLLELDGNNRLGARQLLEVAENEAGDEA
jgi:tetratricopeptide (TPR) repeat protein